MIERKDFLTIEVIQTAIEKEVRMQCSTQPTKWNTTNRLCEFWLPHLEACEDLFTHLGYVDLSMKEIRSEALRKELEAYDRKLGLDVPGNWRFKEYRKRTIVTLVGSITYMRKIYVEPSGVQHAYLDEVLGIRTRFKLAPDAFIWIAKTASEISFRKTAEAFYERSKAKISQWLVMSVVHEEGRLIFEDIYNRAFGNSTDNTKLVSQDRLFVEFDGIHIARQKSTHEPIRPRREYERGRKKRSFELKTAVVYAGKDSRKRRGGVIHFCSNEPASHFWPLLNASIGSVYDVKDIERLHISSDAAGWCRSNDLLPGVSGKDKTHHLDRFHLNRGIRRTFGNTKAASHFIRLTYKRRTKRLMRDLQLVINKAKDKLRYLELQRYLTSSIELIKQGSGPSMGTMEGTNAHVYAARLKARACSWSRHGAYSIAAIRARLATGKELIKPKINNAIYDDSQIRKRMAYEEKQLVRNYTVSQSEGSGYEPVQGSIVLSTHMAPHLYGVLNYS